VLDTKDNNYRLVIARNGGMAAIALFIIYEDQPLGGPALIRDPLTWLFALTIAALSGVAYSLGTRLLWPPRQVSSGRSSAP
jgi:hypothetical protein